jgi:betaine-aldehyde dehydrogenase
MTTLDAPSRTTGTAADVERSLDRPWHMLIGGELVAAADGSSREVVDPASERVVARVPEGSAADVDAAVAAAAVAFPGWRDVPITRRAEVLGRLADTIERHGEELAWIDTIDNGSPIAVMRGDYLLAVEQLRYFAGLALQLRGESIPVADRDAIDFSLREPFGVVGRIVPFNHPLMFAASRIAAPLLAGNTVVLKPSEATPLSALRLGELARDVLPAGVLNIVTGAGPVVGERIATHPDVRRIAFTGGVGVGRRIQQQAAQSAVKVVTLELGGKNPLIVFPDADLDAATAGVLRGMNFAWQGQSCGSTSRVYVHRSLFHQLVESLRERMDAMVVGDPRDEVTDAGPLVSADHYASVCRHIEAGLATPGLELVTGGLPEPGGVGYFVRPTLFAAPDGAAGPLFESEIFGPVLVVAPFDDYDEVLRQANALPLGLTASVWTRDLQTAMRAVRDLECGYVWVNASSMHVPGASFGGTKDSGVGREESIEELESFTQTKNVYIRF